MKTEALQNTLKRYHHFVSWSDEDACFVGYCPDLSRGGMCHDEDPVECYRKLGEAMEWFVADELERGHPLPETSATAVQVSA